MGRFREVKNAVEEVETGVRRGRLRGGADPVGKGSGRASWRRCHLSGDPGSGTTRASALWTEGMTAKVLNAGPGPAPRGRQGTWS